MYKRASINSFGETRQILRFNQSQQAKTVIHHWIKKKHRAIYQAETLQQTVELQHAGEAHSVVTKLSGKMKSW
jgi:hypothetical protein